MIHNHQGSWLFESFYLRDEESWFHFVTSKRKETMPLIVGKRIYNIKSVIVNSRGQKVVKNPLVNAYVLYVAHLRFATRNQSYEIRNLSSILARRSTARFWLKSQHRKLTMWKSFGDYRRWFKIPFVRKCYSSWKFGLILKKVLENLLLSTNPPHKCQVPPGQRPDKHLLGITYLNRILTILIMTSLF